MKKEQYCSRHVETAFNLRAACVRGFDVFFMADSTATYTEAFHRASLLNLADGFAVMDADRRGWRRARKQTPFVM